MKIKKFRSHVGIHSAGDCREMWIAERDVTIELLDGLFHVKREGKGYFCVPMTGVYFFEPESDVRTEAQKEPEDEGSKTEAAAQAASVITPGAPEKKRRGWPKGKPRKPRPQ